MHKPALSAPIASAASLRALDWLNFLLADVQTGVGPFLAIYLATRHWSPQNIGIALTVGGLAGVLAQSPAGALVDAAHGKRRLIVFGLAGLAVSSLLLALQPKVGLVMGAQVVLGVSGVLLGPTVAAITLGLVGTEGFDRRFGRNQAFNSAGNVAAAVLMGAIGYLVSNRAIFLTIPLLVVPCLIALSGISPHEISYSRSRGALEDRDSPSSVSGISGLIRNRALVIFLGCTFLFHFSNAAMLPQLGEMLGQSKPRLSAPFMSASIMVTQFVIAMTAAWIGSKASSSGRRPLLLVGFGVLPIRGVLYTLTKSVPLLIGIQVLDGVANAIFVVVSTLVIADLTRATGRFNLAQGVLATAVGIGASLSTAFAGILVQHLSYRASFLGLAGIGLLAWLLLCFGLPETRQTKLDPEAQEGQG